MYFFVTIKNSWLIKCMKEHARYGETCYLGWHDWGKTNSHWYRTERMHSWLRFIHGGRFIHPARPVVRSHGGRITITDFSRLRPPPEELPAATATTTATGSRRRRATVPAATDQLGENDIDLYRDLDIPVPLSEAEYVKALEEGAEKTELPNLRARHLVSNSQFPLSKYTGFMLDDHRILAFRTDGDGLTSFDVLCFI